MENSGCLSLLPFLPEARNYPKTLDGSLRAKLSHQEEIRSKGPVLGGKWNHQITRIT